LGGFFKKKKQGLESLKSNNGRFFKIKKTPDRGPSPKRKNGLKVPIA
jgi:hypothetical protein